MQHEQYVSVFVAGIQKSGTTSLFAYFCEHPELSAPDRKELHFFDDESRDWSVPFHQALHARFQRAQENRLRFEATPISTFWPNALERIRDYNPEARLILLFRDPIERAWSHWCMEYARQQEPLPFSEAIRAGRDRLDPDDRHTPQWRVHSYVERGFYAGQARRALGLFPRKHILFLRSQDLLDRHRDVLASIASFLGISPFPNTGAKRERSRLDIVYPSELEQRDIRHLAGLYRADVLEFANLTGLDVDDWLTIRNGDPGGRNPAPQQPEGGCK
ncbi:sulfotransferase [Humidesulfovibrio idahonensis]